MRIVATTLPASESRGDRLQTEKTNTLEFSIHCYLCILAPIVIRSSKSYINKITIVSIKDGKGQRYFTTRQANVFSNVSISHITQLEYILRRWGLESAEMLLRMRKAIPNMAVV